jgi:hypothetical protein
LIGDEPSVSGGLYTSVEPAFMSTGSGTKHWG